MSEIAEKIKTQAKDLANEQLSRYESALDYIHSDIRLPQKYSTITIFNDLKTIPSDNRASFLANKLYEILLTLGFSARTRLIFAEDEDSTTLRCIWKTGSDAQLKVNKK